MNIIVVFKFLSPGKQVGLKSDTAYILNTVEEEIRRGRL